jgi:acyl-CoA synthetase (AMP-forming)/AMP-acid ligase II
MEVTRLIHPQTESDKAWSFRDLSAEIQGHAAETSSRVAVMAPGRESLDYNALWIQTGELSRFLDSLGLRRGDAVAMVMPDGPEYLTTFLAVSQVTVCAPLNPAFRASEFEFFLSDIRARALIVQAGLDSVAITVAQGMGIPVIEALVSNRRPAGSLSFTTQVTAHKQDEPCYAQDTALILHTSATTGRPKLVPLTHGQLIAMVAVIRKAFPQADEGRVLMITPHFHLQCILSMLVQLFSGGASICTPGFRPECFLDWMRIFSPTQYTANPTLHQAILSICPSGERHPYFRSLRFVTSGGAPLTDVLQRELELALGVPVVDGYGLTEAGRVTMTPLDPARRKPGSAGICVGPEVAIMGEDGGLLSMGSEGENV